MTIEEYLNKRIEDLEEGPCNSSLVQGKILAYREILSKLPKLEHDVTLKELHQYCDKHREENGHHGCPFLVEGNPDAEEREDRCPHCRFDNEYPCDWDIAEIEKHMKEVENG